MENVILYSTKCPKCKVLEEKLNDAGIPYEKGDVREIIKRGFRSAPLLQVGEEFLIFSKAINWIGARA